MAEGKGHEAGVKLLIGEQPSKIWLAELRKLAKARGSLATGHRRVNSYNVSRLGPSLETRSVRPIEISKTYDLPYKSMSMYFRIL